MTEQKELKCPNCGLAAIPKENGAKIVCGTCGGTFTYIAGEAKLQDVGELDRLKSDVDQLKAGQEELQKTLGTATNPNDPAASYDRRIQAGLDDVPAEKDEEDDDEDEL
jgi:uncharacterized Zn finger protein (UPF0148 family)